MSANICVIRPYHDAVRVKVFEALSELNIDMDSACIFAKGTPDDEIVAELTLLRPEPDLLLIPFHAHNDHTGNMVNGVDTLKRIAGLGESYRTMPAIMPATTFKKDSLEKMFQRHDNLNPERIIVVERSVIDSGELSFYLRSELAARGCHKVS